MPGIYKAVGFFKSIWLQIGLNLKFSSRNSTLIDSIKSENTEQNFQRFLEEQESIYSSSFKKRVAFLRNAQLIPRQLTQLTHALSRMSLCSFASPKFCTSITLIYPPQQLQTSSILKVWQSCAFGLWAFCPYFVWAFRIGVFHY